MTTTANPTTTTPRLIPVAISTSLTLADDISSHATIGETAGHGLVITPDTDRSLHLDACRWTGGWTITHQPSGYNLWRRDNLTLCINCCRNAARLLTNTGIDWTRPKAAILADTAARDAVQQIDTIAEACATGHGCNPPDPTLRDEIVDLIAPHAGNCQDIGCDECDDAIARVGLILAAMAARGVDHAYMDQLLAKVDQLTTDLETAHLELSMATATADALREQLHPTKPAATTTDVDLWADQS